jgi:hypothetical protein
MRKRNKDKGSEGKRGELREGEKDKNRQKERNRS